MPEYISCMHILFHMLKCQATNELLSMTNIKEVHTNTLNFSNDKHQGSAYQYHKLWQYWKLLEHDIVQHRLHFCTAKPTAWKIYFLHRLILFLKYCIPHTCTHQTSWTSTLFLIQRVEGSNLGLKSWLRFLLDSHSPSRYMPGQYLKLGHHHFLPLTT